MNTNKQALVVSPGFLIAATVLSKDAKSSLIKTLMLLAQDVRHPSLQCKKVQGSRAVVYECRVDQKVRLIYDVSGGKIRCWYVGIHDVALRFATQHSPTDAEVIVDDIEVVDFPADLKPVAEFLLNNNVGVVFDELQIEDLERHLHQ